jgi:hypothetical protein
MGMTNDDSVKQKLLDSLAEEPTMVIATAYAYAKNYALCGTDITKAWTTAVEQVSIMEEVSKKAWVEAYDSFKADYENRLKADMVAMLTELRIKIEEQRQNNPEFNVWKDGYNTANDIDCVIIQQKINALK